MEYTQSSSIRSTKEGRRRRSSVSGENVSELEGDVLEKVPSPTKLKKLESVQLNSLACGLLDAIEEVRTKSTRIQGRLSGRLRDCVTSARLIIQTLVDRLEDRGDTTYIKLQNIDLTAQIRAANREKEEREKEIATLETEIWTLRATMSGPKKVVIDDEPRLTQSGQTSAGGRTVSKHTVEKSNQPSTSRAKINIKSKRRETPLVSHTSEEDQYTRIGPAEPAMKAITLIDKTIHDLILAREAQIRSDGSTISVSAIGASFEATDGQLSVPQRRRGRTKDTRPTPPLFREHIEAGNSAIDNDSGDYIVVKRHPRNRQTDGPRAELTSRTGNLGMDGGGRRKPMPRRVPPKSAAVTITGLTEGFSYADAITRARERIPLADLGIQLSRIRHTVNGGRLIEIPGPDGQKKADELASKLREVLSDVATISRPVVRGEMRLVGLDDFVTIAEVKAVITREGVCEEEEVKPGPIRPIFNGLGSVWLQCPPAAAVRITNIGKLRIDWTMARAELLKARPVQCFHCWKFGHVRFACRKPTDRTGRCFRCGETGHKAQTCSAPPRCVICAEANLECDHRLGSIRCSVNPDQPGISTTALGGRARRMTNSDRRTESMDLVNDEDRDPPN